MIYRKLQAGEVIRKGDELLSNDRKRWKKMGFLVGETMPTSWVGQLRRVLKPKKP